MAATTTEASAAAEPEQTSSASMSPKLMIGLVLTLVLISNGTWAAVFFLNRDAPAAEAAEATPDGPAPAPTEAPGPLVELKPLVVNLADGNGSRYLRVGITVELGTEDHQQLFSARSVPLRDAFLSHMSGLQAREVLDREDKERLRGELLELAQEAVSERAIQRVYFTEFMMQ